jgi:hypothetical protein
LLMAAGAVRDSLLHAAAVQAMLHGSSCCSTRLRTVPGSCSSCESSCESWEATLSSCVNVRKQATTAHRLEYTGFLRVQHLEITEPTLIGSPCVATCLKGCRSGP